MEPTGIDNQAREAEIEAIERVVATVQHATQNELVEEFIDRPLHSPRSRGRALVEDLACDGTKADKVIRDPSCSPSGARRGRPHGRIRRGDRDL